MIIESECVKHLCPKKRLRAFAMVFNRGSWCSKYLSKITVQMICHLYASVENMPVAVRLSDCRQLLYCCQQTASEEVLGRLRTGNKRLLSMFI